MVGGGQLAAGQQRTRMAVWVLWGENGVIAARPQTFHPLALALRYVPEIKYGYRGGSIRSTAVFQGSRPAIGDEVTTGGAGNGYRYGVH